jgi:FkbM family methyltransferase
VLDIGGSFGAFSLRLATYAKNKGIPVQIHAFEPNPVVFENYKTNLELNPDITKYIHLHPTGLGNEKGERSFEYTQSNTGAGRVIQNGQGNLKVSIQRLDDFMSAINSPNIAFIKLIAEGFEPEVFKGGWNTITKYKPPIFFEVTEKWWKENGSTIEEVLNKLRVLGYHFMIEHYNEMLPYDLLKFSSRTQFNLMATV